MISATAGFKDRVASRVSKSKVTRVISKSRFSFIFAFLGVFLLWLILSGGLVRLAPGAIRLVALGTILPIILGGFLLFFNKQLVNIVMKTKRVKRREESEVFWDLIQEIVNQEEMDFPELYVVDTKGMNAFAYGHGFFGDASVGVTSGLLATLNRNQIKAVLAHEMGHVKNRDILVSMAMTLTIMVVAFTGWLFMQFGFYIAAYEKGREARTESSSSSGGIIGLLLKLIGLGLLLKALGWVLFYIGRGFAYILQLFVSRQREYAADATAARIMDDPEPLISALQKIIENPKIGGEVTSAAFGFMCTSDPDASSFLSTHPTFEERVNSLRSLAA